MWGKSTLYVVELFSSPYISFLREPTQNCVEGIDLFGLKGENEMNDANEDFRSADSMAEQNQLDTQTMDVLVADLDDPNAPSGIPMSDVLVAREPELEFTPKPDRPKQVKARNELLTDFGKRTLLDRYLLPEESFQDMFGRVAQAYADDTAHAQRLYDYMSQLWFMPATPVLSNGGADRGLPISCFLNAVDDSLDSIVDVWNENVWLASNGGGIGTYWGNVRSIGEKIGRAGKTSGIIPFIRVMDSLTLAISQGSLRRGSAAVYLDIHHPEIEEFLEIRKPSGDFNRKSLNLHHGLNITDDFMEAVAAGEEYPLKSPHTGEIIKHVDARKVWQKILEMRLATGEPYMVFSDTVNKALAKHQRDAGLKVQQSNLCAEIMLATGRDKYDRQRTAVCCLSSINAQKYDEWKDIPGFVEDIMRFLDNVLESFIQGAPEAMNDAKYSAMRERSVGLGLMGFHSMLQQKGIPFESAMAKSWRTSAGIEPIPANIYTHKTLSGSFTVRNPLLEALLEAKGKNTDGIWATILENAFRTAFEIDQRWVIEHASDRAPMICQAQSLNIFLPGDIDKWDLHMLHWTAWEKGVKSLYYCRSKSIQRKK